MSIRAIDMQVLIPRATEAQKQQSNINQQGALQQQQFAEQMQKLAQVRQQQVQGMVKSQGGKVERDDTKEQDSKQRSKRYPQQKVGDSQAEVAEREKAENSASGQDPVLGHIIDIKM